MSEPGPAGWKPSETTRWSLPFSIARAELRTLGDSRAKLLEPGTTSRPRGEVEDEINRQRGGRCL